MTNIAVKGQSAPGAGAGTFLSFSSRPTINDSGTVALLGSITGGSANNGIFIGSGGSLTAIAVQGQSRPGTGTGMFSTLLDPAINAGGTVAFHANVVGGSASEGIFRNDGGSLTAIALQGQTAPGPVAGTFTSLSSGPSLNDSGTVAFFAAVGGVGDRGIFLGDGQQTINAAITGQSLGGSTITNVALLSGADVGGRSGFNEFGQVAYRADLANGSNGIFLFTPTLRYRGTVSGNWDLATNWTLGLKPGAPHDVIIDPAVALTVTGPAAPTTLRSLTVNGTAQASRNLPSS